MIRRMIAVIASFILSLVIVVRTINWQAKWMLVPQSLYQAGQPTFGLTVIHCHESNMTFLENVPTDWKLTVFETCQEHVSQRGSINFTNAGSEECTAYFETMIQNYDDLPLINIFMQSDALVGSGREKRPLGDKGPVFGGLTPFHNIAELEKATRQKMLVEGRQFLHFGWPWPWFGEPIHKNTSYLGHYVTELFVDMGLEHENQTKTRPGACFAVHRDRIRANPKDFYITQQQKILGSNPDEARRRCCALENSWHALLKEPAVLPVESTVDEWYRRY